MDRPIIVTFVGVPGSGKTTFARQLAEQLGAVIFNSDAIRMAMWKTLEAIQNTHTDPEIRKFNNQLTFGAMNYAAEQVINAAISVIYDCNANHVIEREEKHSIARRSKALSVVVRIKVPHEIALNRVQEREEAHDQRRISTEKAEEVLKRFYAEIEEPTNEENTIFINGEATFTDQYESFTKQLHKFA